MASNQDIHIGDRIRFRAVTAWSGATVWRKVVGLAWDGVPLVRYGGWAEFRVRPHEILDVEPV